MSQDARTADICLLVEGSYPYVSGGVANWTHELIESLEEFTFHVVSLTPRNADLQMRYRLPENVLSHTNWPLQYLPEGKSLKTRDADALMHSLEQALSRLTTGNADLDDFGIIEQAVSARRHTLGSRTLLDSPSAWRLVTGMYERAFAECSLLDYFWSWRALLGGLYSLLLPPLPKARAYHALSTGYAGLLLARAKLETNASTLLTEHGIYTNERRVEIASADWLEETISHALTIDSGKGDLRKLWMRTFTNYSRICYQASDQILTLFAGNQEAQIADGAPKDRLRVIPNGIDVARFDHIARKDHERPTVALIGRVVPIKDIKSYLRAVAMMKESLPDIRAYVLGGMEEDPTYAQECKGLVDYLGLNANVTFTGRVVVEDFFPEIDVIIFSSISEAQPLSILEAGACGIPVVATDVGACAEMILGSDKEIPPLGPGGAIVPLSSPKAIADATLHILRDRVAYEAYGTALQRRISTYYNKSDQMTAYRHLYRSVM